MMAKDGGFGTDRFDDGTWSRFLEVTRAREPRELLIQALPLVEAGGRGCDVSCGAGNEVMAMLEHGLSVVAFDGLPEAIDHLKARAAESGVADRLQAAAWRFEEVTWPEREFDLIHAGFSLPFCEPRMFDEFWAGLRRALRPRGLFAGQFFGNRDGWCGAAEGEAMSFHTREAVESMLQGMELVHFDEVERDGETAFKEAKHWHVFHVIARDTQFGS